MKQVQKVFMDKMRIELVLKTAYVASMKRKGKTFQEEKAEWANECLNHNLEI